MTEVNIPPQEKNAIPVDIAVEAGLARRWNKAQGLLAGTSNESFSASQQASSVWEKSRTGERVLLDMTQRLSGFLCQGKTRIHLV